MTTEQETFNIQTIAEPVHVILTRNAKGNYQWEIGYHGRSVNDTLDMLAEIDSRLKREYLPADLETCEHGFIKASCTACNPKAESEK